MSDINIMHELTLESNASVGAIIGLQGDILQGWAMLPNDPELRLAVEIYLDGVFVALVRADVEQPLDVPGDGFHGFVVQLHPKWLQNTQCISARIANQGPWLAGSLKLPVVEAVQADPLATQVWYSGGLSLKGWAFDPNRPAQTLKVRVHEQGQVLATTLANRLNPTLVYRSSANHGFELNLPWELADGQLHILHVELEDGSSVMGSPVHFCTHPEGISALLQQIEHKSCKQTAEWLPLLERLSLIQEARLPCSAGFAHYPQWFSAFQQVKSRQFSVTQRILVVVTGDLEAQKELQTRTSIQQQGLSSEQIQVVVLKDSELPRALWAALSGVDLVVPVQCGDRLAVGALACLSESIGASDAGWGYWDCDQDGPQGERSNPWFKPVWDETLFYGLDVFSSGLFFKAEVLQQAIAYLRDSQASIQPCWYALLAGVVAINQRPVLHIPQVLYHRHFSALRYPEKAQANPERQATLEWLLAQRHPGARLVPLPKYPALNRVLWPLPDDVPLISLIIPTRDQLALLRNCIEGLLTGTDYPALEIIVVDNDSHQAETLEYLEQIAERGVRVLRYPHAFNYSAINNWAAEQAKGSILGLINNDIQVLDPGWLKEMLSQLLRPGVGAVGAKLIWPNGMVQHAGVVVGINSLAAHIGNYWDQQDAGYLGLNQVARELSAVTAACLLVRKVDYQRLGGLDVQAFPVAFNDVDFCLRLAQQGLRCIWTPFACLIHAESASRGKEDAPSKIARAYREQSNFMTRWFSNSELDEYYHPCLSADYLTGPYGGLALPPRSTKVRCITPVKTTA